MSFSSRRRSRVDRHGRAVRPDNDRERRPSGGYRVHSERRFAELVDEALQTMPQVLMAALAGAAATVEALPPPVAGDVEIPLARFVAASGASAAELVIYRRPIEARAESSGNLVELIQAAASRAVADELGLGDFDDEP